MYKHLNKIDRINKMIDNHLGDYFNYTKEELKSHTCLWHLQDDRLRRIRNIILKEVQL